MMYNNFDILPKTFSIKIKPLSLPVLSVSSLFYLCHQPQLGLENDLPLLDKRN